MFKNKLSDSEFILLCTTILVVVASIILSLCIGLVLPPNFISKDQSTTDLKSYCVCQSKYTKTKRLNCKPAFLKNVVKQDQDDLINVIENNPYLVSLNIPAYFDDNSERRFACSGTIISKEWVLASQNCVSDDEWLELQVRAGSAYWSKGGTLHNVNKYAKFYRNGPVGIQIEPPFTFGKLVNAVKFVTENNANTWTEAYSANWYEPDVRKIERYFMETWTKTRCSSIHDYRLGQIQKQVTCHTSSPSSGLVSMNGELIGYKVGICELIHMFVDFQSGPYLRWVHQLIQTGDPKYNLRTYLSGYDASSTNVTIYGTSHSCLNTTSESSGALKNILGNKLDEDKFYDLSPGRSDASLSFGIEMTTGCTENSNFDGATNDSINNSFQQKKNYISSSGTADISIVTPHELPTEESTANHTVTTKDVPREEFRQPQYNTEKFEESKTGHSFQ